MKERFCCTGNSPTTTIKSRKISPVSVSAPLHLILRPPPPASHNWTWKQVPVKKLCQVCHLTVDGQGVRCKSCGFRAHPQCGHYYSTNFTNINNLNLTSTSTLAPTASRAHGANNNLNNYNNNCYKYSTSRDRCSGHYNNFENRPLLLHSVGDNKGKFPTLEQLHQQDILETSASSNTSNCHFEPRIKKLLQVPVPLVVLPTIESKSHHQETRGSDGDSSTRSRFSSSCGDSVAASTAIVVGTATASTETPRSESKTPEITITPGSEVLVEGSTDPGLLLLSSSASVPDSGFTSSGGIQDDGRNSVPVATSSSVGEHQRPTSSIRSTSSGIVVSNYPSVGRRSASATSTSHTASHSTIVQVLVDQHHSHPQPQGYYQGPLDGSPYAVVIPIKKSSPTQQFTSGIPANPMKDLDRLLSALVSEADSIPDIPYHARSDSLPFSYTNIGAIADRQKELQLRGRSQYQRQYSSPAPTAHSSNYQHQYQQPPNSAPARVLTHPIEYDSQRYYSPSSSQQQRLLHVNTDQNYSKTQPPPTQQNLLRESLSSSSFTYGTNNGGGRRTFRSQSADGRAREEEGEVSSEEWLARQMKRLQEKRATKHSAVKNDWLAELKRALPQDTRNVSEYRPLASAISPATRTTSSTSHQRVLSSNSSMPMSTTPSHPYGTAYSSDDDEIEAELLSHSSSRGRKIQRHSSESAYDRGLAQSVNNSRAGSRAPSQLSDTPVSRFPTCPPTPYLNRPVSPKPPRSPKMSRRIHHQTSAASTPSISVHEYGSGSTSFAERSQTPVNPRPVYVVESEVKFARDLSANWYKANASREETIAALRFQPAGYFLIRNSNSFPGAYGLAIKVNESTTAEDSVRHFLIEPTKYGVRLRGSAVEPVFGFISALVYAHSIDALALPIPLNLPRGDSILPASQSQSTTAHLLAQGAACQLLFLGLVGVECITGDSAVSKAMSIITDTTSPTIVSLRLSKHGLTLTDIHRQRFFRLHFPLPGISYTALDPQNRTIAYENRIRKLFAIVARASNGTENSCVVLAELEEGGHSEQEVRDTMDRLGYDDTLNLEQMFKLQSELNKQ